MDVWRRGKLILAWRVGWAVHEVCDQVICFLYQSRSPGTRWDARKRSVQNPMRCSAMYFPICWKFGFQFWNTQLFIVPFPSGFEHDVHLINFHVKFDSQFSIKYFYIYAIAVMKITGENGSICS